MPKGKVEPSWEILTVLILLAMLAGIVIGGLLTIVALTLGG